MSTRVRPVTANSVRRARCENRANATRSLHYARRVVISVARASTNADDDELSGTRPMMTQDGGTQLTRGNQSDVACARRRRCRRHSASARARTPSPRARTTVELSFSPRSSPSAPRAIASHADGERVDGARGPIRVPERRTKALRDQGASALARLGAATQVSTTSHS